LVAFSFTGAAVPSSCFDFLVVGLLLVSFSAFFLGTSTSASLSSSLRKSAARLRGLIDRGTSPLALGFEAGLASAAAPLALFFFRIGLVVSFGGSAAAALASTFFVFFAGESTVAAAAAAKTCQSLQTIESRGFQTYPCASYPSYPEPFFKLQNGMNESGERELFC
jgi:hypothetical protein